MCAILNHVFVLLSIIHTNSALGIGSRCITPNQRLARCISLIRCPVILDALLALEDDALQFAKESQCGFDTKVLVCCGTVAYKSDDIYDCLTPNGESGQSKPLSSCKVISDQLKVDPNGTEFFKQSSEYGDYGERDEPWVCCGNHSGFLRISPLLPTPDVCGVHFQHKKIMGGNILGLYEHAWLTLLRYEFGNGTDAGFKCGGSLINNRYVLTAAHCIVINPHHGYALKSVRLGEWRISTDEDCDIALCANPVLDVNIEETIVHAEYIRRSKQNDIALIRLDINVNYSESIRPICLLPLERTKPVEDLSLTVSGWGITENGTQSDYKLAVSVPLVPFKKCSRSLRKWNVISDNQVCAGGIAGEDACQGDSGGPLTGTIRRSTVYQYYLEGVISWGVQCGVENMPAVSVRVFKYNNWIVNHLKEF